jgi:ribonuclease HI
VAARSGPGFPGTHHLSASGTRAAGAASASGQPLAAPLREPDLFSQQELTQQGTSGRKTQEPALPRQTIGQQTTGQQNIGQQTTSQQDFAQLDFAQLDDGAFDLAGASGQAQTAPPEALVEELERELLGPLVRGDIGRTAVLLHPDFLEIGSSGRVWTRDAMMMALEEDPGERTDIEILGADRIGPAAVLLTYRSFARSGTTLRSSLWVLDGDRWRLRFHQGTPEA